MPKQKFSLRWRDIDDKWDENIQALQSTNDRATISGDLKLFAYQISNGMEYLGSKHILHRDLACRNVLLTEKLIAKISDFGLAAEAQKLNQQENNASLPPFFNNAPELYHKGFFDYTKNGNKSDVWSFGVLLWEMYTFCREKPYAEWGLDKLPSKEQLVEYLKGLTNDQRLRNKDENRLEKVKICLKV